MFAPTASTTLFLLGGIIKKEVMSCVVAILVMAYYH
jgi:hypothetical protein